MVTLDQAFTLALKEERDWGNDGEYRIVKASERKDAWGFTLQDPNLPFSTPYTFFISKEDGHIFEGPSVPPLENLDWWHQSHVIDLPVRPDGRIVHMPEPADSDCEAIYQL